MGSVVEPIIEVAQDLGAFIWGEIPNITAAVTGNGIIMAFLGIALIGACVGMFARLLRSV